MVIYFRYLLLAMQCACKCAKKMSSPAAGYRVMDTGGVGFRSDTAVDYLNQGIGFRDIAPLCTDKSPGQS